jgi:hypothetical protein
MATNQRPILEQPQGPDGLFLVPKDFDAKREVLWTKLRLDSARVAQYQDSHCGPFPNTYDPAGAYLCGGRKDGKSKPCNKLQGRECLIRIKPIGDIHHFSCGFWEIENFGDPEGRYCRQGKMDDKRINGGSTPNDLGFGCWHCIYGQQHMPRPDSEGRMRFCALKGHPVEDRSCCADNEHGKQNKLVNISSLYGD